MKSERVGVGVQVAKLGLAHQATPPEDREDRPANRPFPVPYRTEKRFFTMPRRWPRCEVCVPGEEEEEPEPPKKPPRERPRSMKPVQPVRPVEEEPVGPVGPVRPVGPVEPVEHVRLRVEVPDSDWPSDLYMKQLMLAILQAFKAAKALGLCSKEAIERVNLEFWFDTNPSMLMLRDYVKNPGCCRLSVRDMALIDQCSLLFDLWDMYKHSNIQVIQQVGCQSPIRCPNPPPPPPCPSAPSTTVVVDAPQPIKPLPYPRVFIDCPHEPVKPDLSPTKIVIDAQFEPSNPVFCHTKSWADDGKATCCGSTTFVLDSIPKPPKTLSCPQLVSCHVDACPSDASCGGCLDDCESVGKRMLDCYLSKKAMIRSLVAGDFHDCPGVIHERCPSSPSYTKVAMRNEALGEPQAGQRMLKLLFFTWNAIVWNVQKLADSKCKRKQKSRSRHDTTD